MYNKSFLIVGGAGFIGSHFIDFLLAKKEVKKVSLYDNFTSGQAWHYEHHKNDPRLNVARGDVKDLPRLIEASQGHDVVIHLASNPDIAKAVTEPDIDFREGTLLTSNVVEACRINKINRMLYASGSGIYGDLGTLDAFEDYGPKTPVSTYGASKLAGEALMSSYSYMFDMKASAFRFANVVGPRQTHGVGFDFVRRLKNNPKELRILGDGTQSKSYAYVTDIISGVMTAFEKQESFYEVYNIGTGDYITVTEIADIACECLGIDPKTVDYQYSGGNRGWKGDVPIVRINTDRMQSYGWKSQHKSSEALRKSILAMLKEIS